jgi:hypothetical protein
VALLTESLLVAAAPALAIPADRSAAQLTAHIDLIITSRSSVDTTKGTSKAWQAIRSSRKWDSLKKRVRIQLSLESFFDGGWQEFDFDGQLSKEKQKVPATRLTPQAATSPPPAAPAMKIVYTKLSGSQWGYLCSSLMRRAAWSRLPECQFGRCQDANSTRCGPAPARPGAETSPSAVFGIAMLQR